VTLRNCQSENTENATPKEEEAEAENKSQRMGKMKNIWQGKR
jgi:hypothetical protein